MYTRYCDSTQEKKQSHTLHFNVINTNLIIWASLRAGLSPLAFFVRTKKSSDNGSIPPAKYGFNSVLICSIRVICVLLFVLLFYAAQNETVSFTQHSNRIICQHRAGDAKGSVLLFAPFSEQKTVARQKSTRLLSGVV